jgi:hypothetical protein
MISTGKMVVVHSSHMKHLVGLISSICIKPPFLQHIFITPHFFYLNYRVYGILQDKINIIY